MPRPAHVSLSISERKHILPAFSNWLEEHLAAAVAVGLRTLTGAVAALLQLIFALSRGLMWPHYSA
jgi:hypothetical protein